MLKIFNLLLFVYNVNGVDWVALQSNQQLPTLPMDICEVGKYYRHKCNVCECIPPGLTRCKTLTCIGDPVRKSDRYDSSGCVRGTTFHVWCNACKCRDGVHVTCTKKKCT